MITQIPVHRNAPIFSTTRIRRDAKPPLRQIAWWFLAAYWVLTLPATALDTCAVVDIDGAGFDTCNRLKSTPGVRWWVEMGDELLLCGNSELVSQATKHGRYIKEVLQNVNREGIRVVHGESMLRTGYHDARTLVRSRRHEIIETDGSLSSTSNDDFRMRTLPLPAVVLRRLENSPPQSSKAFAPSMQTLVQEVDGQRWFADLETLAEFNRHSYNDEIFDAETWIVHTFEAMPNITVTTPGFMMDGREVHNVVGTLSGSHRPYEWYIVGGHYDSTSQNPSIAAPGAEDNASGCAGVLEMARIFSANPPEATIVFICYVGEEQGLLGSADHVANLVAAGDIDNVQAMLNMDMIGYTSDSDLDCLLESDQDGQPLIDAFAAAATSFTDLRIETTNFAWGSDHVPYLNHGIQALLTIENDWFEYPDYHSTTDLPENITIAMGREILKMNVGALAGMVGHAGPEIFADGFESGDVSRWTGH